MHQIARLPAVGQTQLARNPRANPSGASAPKIRQRRQNLRQMSNAMVAAAPATSSIASVSVESSNRAVGQLVFRAVMA